MIPIKASALIKGDQFKVRPESPQLYTVKSVQMSSENGEWLIVSVQERPDVTMPRHTELYAVTMCRLVEVPCVLPRHEGGPLALLHNRANGAPPFGVMCRQCDEETTAEVMASLAEERERKAS